MEFVINSAKKNDNSPAHMYIGCESDSIDICVMQDGNQFDFCISQDDWRRLNSFICDKLMIPNK